MVTTPRSTVHLYFSLFAITLASLAALFFGLESLDDPATTDRMLAENGPVESLSALGYFLCLGLMLKKGGLSYARAHYPLMILVLMFGLRELDMDKAFTTIGILKSRFIVDWNMPLAEKLIGLAVLAILVTAVGLTLRRYLVNFLSNLRHFRIVSVGVGLTVGLLCFTKSIDGLGRKLAPLGIDINEGINNTAGHLEEVLELGIPILLIISTFAYFRTKAAENPPQVATVCTLYTKWHGEAQSEAPSENGICAAAKAGADASGKQSNVAPAVAHHR